MKWRQINPFVLLAVVWLVWSLVGLIYCPYNPQAQDFLGQRFAGPTAAHWFGIDELGRDLFSRLWRGSGRTAILGLAAASLSLGMATVLLGLEQTGPRWASRFLRGIVSLSIALPVVFIGLVLAVFMTRSTGTLVVAAALGGVPFAFRQLRIMWLEQQNAVYVLASRALGGGRWHALRFAIWPNLRPQVSGLARLLFAMGVLELSGLSFLGLTGDPDLAELGTMLRQNQAYLFQQPMLVIWPGVFLVGMLLVVHLSGSGKSTE